MPRPKTKKVEAEVKAAVQAVSGLNVNNVVSQIGTLQVDVQSTLANLSATITGKLAEVDQIDKAIAAKNEQLQELYNIEAEAVRLEEIKLQREAEIADWDADRAHRDQENREAVNERRKAWAREDEEHVYNVARRNQRAEEDYKALLNQHQREEAIRQQNLERNWAERENLLATQENEVVALKTQVANFDSRLKSEVEKGQAIVAANLKKQYEQDVVLLKKDMEVATKLHQAEKAALAQTISSLNDQLDSIKAQLDAARADAKEVTVSALQAASDKMTAAVVQRMADSQAQSGKSSK